MENLPEEKNRCCFNNIVPTKTVALSQWRGVEDTKDSRANLKTLPTGNELEFINTPRRNELPNNESILNKNFI